MNVHLRGQNVDGKTDKTKVVVSGSWHLILVYNANIYINRTYKFVITKENNKSHGNDLWNLLAVH